MVAPYLDLYPEVNNGAHRKAADLVGAPSLVWHQALWNPRQSDFEKRFRAKAIRYYLWKLHDHIGLSFGGVAEPQRSRDIRVGSLDRVRVITFTFAWHGIRTKIRFEVHTEYWSITTMLDLSVDLSASLDATGRELADKFTSLKELLLEQQISGENVTSSSVGADIKTLHRNLYKDVWEKFDAEILDAQGFLRPGAFLGKRFGDFRGVVTCERYPSPSRRKEKCLAKLQLQRGPVQDPFYRQREDERGQWHWTGHLKQSWARSRLGDAWRFLMAPETTLPGRLEYTVSRLLDGRQLYASALGPQPLEHQGVRRAEPIYFYLHSATQCERQIGRTVDRLFQLGTLRLASIIALPALKSVSQLLRALEHRTEDARSSLDKLIQESNKQNYVSQAGSESRQALQEMVLGELFGIRNELADLLQGNALSNKDLGGESLSYRLSRSRYYRTQFEKLVPDLRARRLEGYQPYGEFVRRRLEGAFGFIDAVERRVNELTVKLNSLDQLYLSTALTILTGEIEVSQNLTASIQRQALKTDKNLTRLQVFAEAVLMLGLAPYYIFTLVYKDWYGCEESAHCERFASGSLNQTQWTLSAIWLFLAIVWAYRTRHEISKWAISGARYARASRNAEIRRRLRAGLQRRRRRFWRALLGRPEAPA